MFMLSRFGWRTAVRIASLAALGLVAIGPASGQRIRIPDWPVQYSQSLPTTVPTQASPLPPLQTMPQAGVNPATVSPPLLQLPPLNPPPGAVPGAGFDVYGNAANQVPTIPFSQSPTGSGAMIYPPPNSYPWVNPNPAATLPPSTFPQANGAPSIYGPVPGSPYFGDATWQSNSGQWPNNPNAWPNQAWSRVRDQWLPRLIEHPRLRYTYLYGNGGDDLQINDIELAASLTFPSLFATNQPWRASPGFIFHLWDGPDTAVTGADLPSKAYSAFLSFDFLTSFSQPIGGEVNFTVGMYTDFDHVTTDSLRLTGVGLGWFRLNNTTTFKLGVEYLDRVDIKLLPAVGVFLMPNPNLKYDLYFPRPKIAWRSPNNYNYEVWTYIGGEYGGGSWTIERLSGMGDQVDINDIRIVLGSEWMGPRGFTGFGEIGYVFNRELVYRSNDTVPVPISDTFMIRMGLAY